MDLDSWPAVVGGKNSEKQLHKLYNTVCRMYNERNMYYVIKIQINIFITISSDRDGKIFFPDPLRVFVFVNIDADTYT